MDTIRLWNKTDLEKIKHGKDDELINTFLNVKTFSEEEIKVYPYHARKTYLAWFDEDEPVKFYATDDKNAWKFIREHYRTDNLISIDREETEFYPVKEQ